MAGLSRIFYSSTVLQSIISMQLARIKSDEMGYTSTITDIAGILTADIDTLLDAITDHTITAIYVSCLTNSTAATGKLSYDQLAFLNQLLVTASKGVVMDSGTCQHNTGTTSIIFAAATASATNDTYNGKYVRTAGVTAISRYISDYDGSSKVATVITTGTAITDEDTYSVFTPSTKVYLIGDAASSETACRVAWRTMWGTKQFPMIVNLLGGSGTIATGLNGVTDGVTTFEQSVLTSVQSGGSPHTTTTFLESTNYFAAIDCHKNMYIGIESGTLGVGQVRQIASNTRTVLTVTPAWTAPTGTVVYTVCTNYNHCLAHKYLTLSIPTYLYATDSDTKAIWLKLIDKYGTLTKPTTRVEGDLELLQVYIERGRCIFDADTLSVV